MRLPIDTSSMTFMCAAPARPVTDFETEAAQGRRDDG